MFSNKSLDIYLLMLHANNTDHSNSDLPHKILNATLNIVNASL